MHNHFLRVGAALFVAAFLPYAFAKDYLPTAYGVMGRTATQSALAAGVLWAWLAFHVEDRIKRWAIIGAWLAIFAVINNAMAWEYRDIYQRELATLQGAVNFLRANPKAKSLAIPPIVGRGFVPAFGFAAQWDFNSALHMASGRKDVEGHVVVPR